MKNKILILLMLISICLMGCGGEEFDGIIVKDKDGNVYKLEHNIADAYFIQKFDAAELKVIINMKEEK